MPWRDSKAGTVTNDNAAAGDVGEQISAQLAVGAATALVTATAKTITSITLTPGDWEVAGVINFLPAATTSITQLARGSSATTNALGADDTYAEDVNPAEVPTAIAIRKVIPSQRFSVAVNTPVYLVAKAVFSAAALTAYGTIRARRVR